MTDKKDRQVQKKEGFEPYLLWFQHEWGMDGRGTQHKVDVWAEIRETRC